MSHISRNNIFRLTGVRNIASNAPHGSLVYRTHADVAKRELAFRTTPGAPVHAGNPNLNQLNQSTEYSHPRVFRKRGNSTHSATYSM